MTRPTFDIIWDYDNVTYPFSSRAHELLTRAGITKGRPITRWRMEEDFECTSEVLRAALGEVTLTGELYDAPLIPGVLPQMRRLRGHGHRIHVVTARGFGQHGDLIQAITRDQIRSEGVPLDSLTFAKDKTVVPAHFALDDGHHNYIQLNAAGVMVYLMDQPHNQAFQGVRRVRSVEEFANHVLHVASVIV